MQHSFANNSYLARKKSSFDKTSPQLTPWLYKSGSCEVNFRSKVNSCVTTLVHSTHLNQMGSNHGPHSNDMQQRAATLYELDNSVTEVVEVQSNGRHAMLRWLISNTGRLTRTSCCTDCQLGGTGLAQLSKETHSWRKIELPRRIVK